MRVVESPTGTARAVLLTGCGALFDLRYIGIVERPAGAAGTVLLFVSMFLAGSGALLDNPDKPELSFHEEACLQCGICADTCPEKAITLVPQLNLADSALSGRVLDPDPLGGGRDDGREPPGGGREPRA